MWFVRFLVFWLLTSGFWLSAQQGAGPFRPGTGVPTGLPPTVPQKGPAYYPGRIAFIDSQGLLDGLTGTAGNCVLIDGSSQPCDSGGGGGGGTGALFTGAEIPGGTINGSNAVFTLANAPTPAASLLLMKNGLVLKATVDYTLSGSTITFLTGAIPTPPDTLQAWYNVASSMGGVSLTGTPSVGYVPTATGSTTATWQAPAGGVWGSITGTLSNQTDLATALATKPTAALVTSVGSPGLDTNVPSEKAVATAIAGVSAGQTEWGFITGTLTNQTDLETALATKPTAALVTTVGSPGLNTNVPSEEAVATALAALSGGNNGQQALEYRFCTRDDTQGNWGNGGVHFHGVSINGSGDGFNPCFYQFPSDGTGYAVLDHYLPSTWSSTPGMALSVLWAPSDNTSGNEQWTAATYCAGPGAVMYANAPTFNAAQTATTAVTSLSAYGLYITTFSSLTQTGCAAGDMLEIQLQNSASGSGSTYASALYVFGALLNQNGMSSSSGSISTTTDLLQGDGTGNAADSGIAAANVAVLSSGSLLQATEFPAFTGDCTTTAGGVVVACGSAIARTGADINTSNQVTVTHLGAGLPRAQGGLNSTSAGTGILRDGTTPAASELSGDCTTSGSNAITCTKTNGTAYAASATTDATNAANIGSGTLPDARLSAGMSRRVCDIAVGDESASALANAQLGPQKRLCYIPAAATIVEMDVSADGGTPNVIVGNNAAGTVTNIVSGALATAASGGIACSNTGGTTGIDGATTCTNTLQNTSLAAGSYLELVSGTAGGTAKLMTIHVIYTVN